VLLSTRDVAAQSKFRVQGFSVVRKVGKNKNLRVGGDENIIEINTSVSE